MSPCLQFLIGWLLICSAIGALWAMAGFRAKSRRRQGGPR